MTSAAEPGFTAVQLVVAVTALLGLALVLPAGVAVAINQSRVERTVLAIEAIAGAVGPGGRHEAGLLVGPGETPEVRGDLGGGWQSARTASLAAALGDQPVSADPWGNRYHVVVGLHQMLVISAGANGVIETPFPPPDAGPTRAGGDDIGAATGMRR